ncbi:hypothetical protein [Roseovarius sp.]|uniref:tetratricopeptide repeat protein n=1 Tax=Roseovarius sp. TaxID=1486281 RepID=UPI00261F1D0E|nr:hypothetical protein [Roseovarius sp.]
MKHLVLAFGVILAVSGPLAAASCPEAPDHTSALDALIIKAQGAPDERAGRVISNEMWQYWADAPDAYAQGLLDEGMTRRAAYDFEGAIKAFDALVAYCPEYAEGYNQRAFVNFIRQDYGAALPDLDRAIELSPRHIAALSGQALTLMALERPGEAVLALRAALALNPWLPERHLLRALEAAEKEL